MTVLRLLPLLALALLPASSSAATNAPVIALSVDGAIGPATADYVHRGLARADKAGAQLVVLRLDTPGGLDTSMRKIVQDILASPVPVAVFVAPSGARAASAGTFILYASHIAAMAPGTNLGAASPVAIGAAPIPDPVATADKGKGPEGKRGDVHERKATQDAAAYIRSLAQARGRNVEWGEKAVLDAASLSAVEASKHNVIEVIAADVPDLVRQLDGRKVSLATGERTLQTSGAPLQAIDPDWTSRLLAVLTDPSVALVLMLLGVYGLLFELGNPGYVFPGVIGAVCLLLALYALHLLPVNYAGLALIGVGIAFMVAELFFPAYGSLGVGGVVAFAAGAVMLIDAGVPGFAIPWSLIAALALVTVAFVLIVGNLALRARRAPIVSGMSSLVGADGEMLDDAAGTGWANIRGETWRVVTAAHLTRGQKIRVIGVDGATPRVAPAEGA